MTRPRLLTNPYAQYTTGIDIPGLKAAAGEEYHYPWIAPEGHVQHRKEIPVASVAGKLAPGWSILPGWKIGTEGKGQGMRQQVFKLLYDGKLTDKYALSPEGAAELSHKIDPSTGKRWVPEWRKAKANPAFFMTDDEDDDAPVRIRAPRPKRDASSAAAARLTPAQMQKVADLMRGGLSRAEAVAFVLTPKENPHSILARARALNAQYDRDHYTGSSASQLAQARRLGAAYDQDTYTGSSPEQLEYARMLEQDYDLSRDNPRVFKKGKGKFKEIPQSVNARQRWLDEAASISARGLGGYEREAGLGEYPQAVRFQQMAQNNPFWGTPGGSLVHHSDEAWAGYQTRHAGVRLPAQAVREALLEKQGSLAPGWSTRSGKKVAGNGKSYNVIGLYFKGKDTGLYATDDRKAVEMSHAYNPETGKRKKV